MHILCYSKSFTVIAIIKSIVFIIIIPNISNYYCYYFELRKLSHDDVSAGKFECTEVSNCAEG